MQKKNLYEILEKLPESLNFVSLRIRARGLRYAITMDKKYLSSMTSRLIEFVTNNNIDQSSYKEIILRAFSGLSEENRAYISGQLLELLNKYDRHSETSFSINNIINALGQLQAKEAVPELKALLRDNEYRVRQSAASALGKYDLDILVSGLFLGLSHDDIFVRKNQYLLSDTILMKMAKKNYKKL
jgi:uncharacterized membrane-anchored protein YjiN (DUF445 family)